MHFASAFDVDKVGVSVVDASGVGASGVDASGVGAAGVGAAGVDASGVDAAGVEASGVEASGVGASDFAAGGSSSAFGLESDVDGAVLVVGAGDCALEPAMGVDEPLPAPNGAFPRPEPPSNHTQ